jgi:hypothetical protein
MCRQERLIDGLSSGRLTLERLTLTGGSPNGDGGAIRGGAVSLVRVTVTQNGGIKGGGIAAATLDADELTVTYNRAGINAEGGGIWVSGDAVLRNSNISSNSGAARGGGIRANGKVTLIDTRIMENEVRLGLPLSGPPLTPAQATVSGGGILADAVETDRVTIAKNSSCTFAASGGRDAELPGAVGAAISARTAKLTNTTLSENDANDCLSPAKISAGSVLALSESLSLDHVTLSNSALFDQTHDLVHAPDLTIRRSVLFGRGLRLCDSPTNKASSYSLFTDSSCGLSGSGNALLPQDFRFGDLEENGAAVPTLGAVSALIDQIPLNQCPVKVDARGTPRPQGSACDIGAVEAIP